MATQTIAQRRNVIEPFQHPAPKLEMAPPSMQPWTMTPSSLSPLHMSPPNMLLPNFSPIQDHMPLPTLSASTFIPPQSFLTHDVGWPINVIRFSKADPNLLMLGGPGNLSLWLVEDVEREVRGDADMIARGIYEVRVKVRPQVQILKTLKLDGEVLDLQFSPHDGTLLFVALSTGDLNLYRVRSNAIKLLSTHSIMDQNDGITSLVISPTTPLLVAGSRSGQVHLITLPRSTPRENNTLTPVSTLPRHSSTVTTLTISADGKRLYTASDSGLLTSWNITRPATPKQKWSDELDTAINTLLVWPHPSNRDVGHKRRALLVGGGNQFRALDMSAQNRPPLTTQTLEIEQALRFAPLPTLPSEKETKSTPAGAFSHQESPDTDIDTEWGGLIAACGKGGSRILIHKQKFEEVFLPRRDGSGIVDWKTPDGVKMDHEGRERKFWWYDLADLIEDFDGDEVTAGDATAVIDYDPLFKDAGEQRKRRGWRLCGASKTGRVVFWQVYVE